MNRERPPRNDDKSRLFFGFEVETLPKLKLPPARYLNEKDRHITLAFLGDVDLSALLEHLQRFPPPDFTTGFVGEFTEVAFFPPHHPHAVVWKAQFHNKERKIRTFQHDFSKWLRVIGFPPTDPDREWVPHVTMGRQPFEQSKWREHFQPSPFVASNFHLYESVGELRYEPRWTYALVRPFEYIAEDVLRVRGKTLSELLLHAQVALSLKFPHIWEYSKEGTLRNHRELLENLNKSISGARGKFDMPLQSVTAEEGPLNVDDMSLEWDIGINLMYQK